MREEQRRHRQEEKLTECSSQRAEHHPRYQRIIGTSVWPLA